MTKFVVSAIAVLILASLASADPDRAATSLTDPTILGMITDDDFFSVADLTTLLTPTAPQGTEHYGPFPSGSPDSGTCGNDWATDTFDRHFTVRATSPTTFTIVEQFKKGTFVTMAGDSPGACDPNNPPPSTIVAGKKGDMHGYLIITVTGAQTSHDSSCIAAMPLAPCTTAGFVETHFTGAAFTIGTFFFHYSAGDQIRAEHEWKNASADRGGNHGDISSNFP